MRVVGIYSFKRGKEIMESDYRRELGEIYQIIALIDAEAHKTKKSKEERKNYRMLYNPKSFNKAFKKEFLARGWKSKRVYCDYPTEFYVDGYTLPETKGRKKQEYREMDFLKNRVGIELQFGKYAFMVYNVAAKMTIFHNLGLINIGVEIVPARELQIDMSSGVSFFEQFVWDLEKRGISDIDIPVLVLGIAKNPSQDHNLQPPQRTLWDTS
jgi:hypothetical protein